MLQIQFNQADFRRWMRATDKIQAKAKLWIESNMQIYCAVDYFQLVHKNIVSEKYAGSYAPYSKKYAAWKQKRYPYPGWWKVTHALLNSLTVFKHGDGWVGGIPSGMKAAVYGAAGEFEKVREEQPARPVFTPTMEEYAKNKKNGWEKRGREALDHIKTAWA